MEPTVLSRYKDWTSLILWTFMNQVSLDGPELLIGLRNFLSWFFLPKTLFSTTFFRLDGSLLMATFLRNFISALINHSSSNLKISIWKKLNHYKWKKWTRSNDKICLPTGKLNKYLHSPWRPGDEVLYVSVPVKLPRLDRAGLKDKLSAISEDQVKRRRGGWWGWPIGWAEPWQPVLDAGHNSHMEEVGPGGWDAGLGLITAAPECLPAIFPDVELYRRWRSNLSPVTAWRAGHGAGGILKVRVDVTG